MADFLDPIRERVAEAKANAPIQVGQRLHDMLDRRKSLRDAMVDDCAALIAEVQRLREENERLKKDVRFVSDFSREAIP